MKTRNSVFIEHQNLIHYTMRRNMPLIKGLGLEYDDVFQDLAIRALKAIEDYNPDKGASLPTYIVKMAKYELLRIKRKLSQKSRKPIFKLVYLDGLLENEQTVDVPVDVDFDAALVIGEIVALMSEREREAVAARMNGVSMNRLNPRQKKALSRTQHRYTRLYSMGGTLKYA